MEGEDGSPWGHRQAGDSFSPHPSLIRCTCSAQHLKDNTLSLLFQFFHTPASALVRTFCPTASGRTEPSATTALAWLLTRACHCAVAHTLPRTFRTTLRPSITTPLAWLLTVPAPVLLQTLCPTASGQRCAFSCLTLSTTCSALYHACHCLVQIPCPAALEQRFALLVQLFRSSLPLLAIHCCSYCAPQLQDNALPSVSPGEDCSRHHVDSQRDQQGPVRRGAGGGELREGAA